MQEQLPLFPDSPPRPKASTKTPHYVYVLRCPATNKPRYVGITSNPQIRLKTHFRDASQRKTKRHAWISSLAKQGFSPILEVVEVTLFPDIAEQAWIKKLRLKGADLVNGTIGGQNPPESWRKNQIKGLSKPHGRKYPVLWHCLRSLGQDLRGYKHIPPMSPQTRAKGLLAQKQLRAIVAQGHDAIKRFEFLWVKAHPNWQEFH